MSNQGYVKTEITDRISTIEFYHPASNSLPGNLLKQLAEAIIIAGDNYDLRAIILKSAGDRAFCGGASFDELAAIDNIETGKKFFSGFANVINAMRKCPHLIIGRVQGKAVGGGVGLASATDYCFATKYASIKLSELAVGIGPFVVGPAVARKIGVSGMSQLAINATEWQTADWAQSKGLYTELFDDTKKMDRAIEALATKLVHANPAALVELKDMFWRGTEDWDELLIQRAAISGDLVLSDFTKNAIKQFKSR